MSRSSSNEGRDRRGHDNRRRPADDDHGKRRRRRESRSVESEDDEADHHHRRDHIERQDRSAGKTHDDSNSSRHDRRRKERSRSPYSSSRHARRSRSPPPRRRRRSPKSESKSPPRKSKGPLPSQNESFRGELVKTGAPDDQMPPADKQKPNFKPTGLLAKEANTVAGSTTVLKYHEPPEARKPSPKEQWRMYVFKKKDLLDTVYLHHKSVWLMGRDEKVTDLLLEHPSISKQHAVIQFRYISSTNEFGDKKSKVKPYLIDLQSANGTKLNGKKVEASRYIELVDQDVIAFGDSEREYVMMLPSAG